MPSPLLQRLSHAVRLCIFQDYLGNCSMSIALLRQTCHEIRSEIDSVVKSTWDGGSEPSFERQVDGGKLDGCTMAMIESAVGRIDARTIDVHHWDALFKNAVEHEHLDDIDRLLCMFVFPTSSIFSCFTGSLRILHDIGGGTNKHYLDAFVRLISKCDKKRMHHFYLRLPCDCIRRDFLHSAIGQSMFAILEAVPEARLYIASVSPKKTRDDTFVKSIAQAVGSSGNAEMLRYIVDLLNPSEHKLFYKLCFVAAAGANHVSLLKCIDADQTDRDSAFFQALSYDCQETLQYLSYTSLSSDMVCNCLLQAARTGNSAAFRRVLSLQSDPLSKQWHAAFAQYLDGIHSLTTALQRSDEDFAFFMELYCTHFPSLLVAHCVRMLPVFGSAPSRSPDAKKISTLTTILRRCSHLAASINSLQQNVLKFMDAKPREVYLDVLHFLLQSDRFELDLANDTMQSLLPCLVSHPLNMEEAEEMARLAFTNEAFDWVTEHFGIYITGEDATKFLNHLSDWPLHTHHYDLHANYFGRCLKLGATFQFGCNGVVDMISVWMGIPLPKNLDFARVFGILGKVVNTGRLDFVKKFVALLLTAQIPPQLYQINLRLAISMHGDVSLVRSSTTGCFKKKVHNAFSAGHMRLYHYVCELLGVQPEDVLNIPSDVQQKDTTSSPSLFGL